MSQNKSAAAAEEADSAVLRRTATPAASQQSVSVEQLDLQLCPDASAADKEEDGAVATHEGTDRAQDGGKTTVFFTPVCTKNRTLGQDRLENHTLGTR